MSQVDSPDPATAAASVTETASDAAAELDAAAVAVPPATADGTPVNPGPAPDTADADPLDADEIAAIVRGYTFATTTPDLGALHNGEPVADAEVRTPLAMMNRHGVVAGATGTGKTRALNGRR